MLARPAACQASAVPQVCGKAAALLVKGSVSIAGAFEQPSRLSMLELCANPGLAYDCF